MDEDFEAFKRRLPLLDYLRQHNWSGRPAGRYEVVGLCPLHEETRPSFYVNTRKDVFYCHGCGRGGDLIRFVQLSRHLSSRQSLTYLDPQRVAASDSTSAFRFHDQRPRRHRRPRHPQRVPRCALSGGARISSALPAPQTDGAGPSEG